MTIANRPGLAEFLRFCIVGAVGFMVDAGVLMLCIHVFGVDAVSGRLVSFAIAVMATFELNRRWAFQRGGHSTYFALLATYLGVQGLGFLCNLGIYTLLYVALPQPFNAPLFCLVVASAFALLVNYAGARLVVFRARGLRAHPRRG